eukprot:TRINITY_DN7363_c0_g2_i5.p1 TRINITY_DN7363_c0_g2~~TRINITY_DN7363_c0_g2_i5.p1  ORF type:complete len:304 (-),score=75.13 TRINITY_DN7363_c0_g2_i5:81-992(-)
MKEQKFDISRERVLDESISDVLLCKICFELLEDPVECSECNSEFCRKCIDHWFARNPVCPNRCSSASLQKPHKVIINMLMALKVTCKNSSLSCNFIDTVESVLAHEDVCPYNIMQCPNRSRGCAETFPSKDLAEHLEACEYVREECKNGCGQMLTKKKQKSHSCIQYLKREMETHRGALKELEVRIAKMKRKAMCLPFVNKGIVCEKCKEKDFIGQSYRCATCVNYNLCAVCQKIIKHKHEVQKVPMEIFDIEVVSIEKQMVTDPIRGPMQRFKVAVVIKSESESDFEPVSYTHLTLPTTPYV